MRCSVVGAVILLCLLQKCTAKAIDNLDFFANISQYVDYSDIEEEDKKYTLQKLITDTDDENEKWTTEADEGATTEKVSVNQTLRDPRILPATGVATAGQFPYFVYVKSTQKDGTTVVDCGGALLSDTWVLTAAQCVATAASISVIAGVIASTATTPASTGIPTVHPGYRKNYGIHDIALVRLQTPFTLGANIYPIKLTKKDDHHRLNAVTVRTVGFGPADDTKAVVAALRFVDLVHLSKSLCNAQTLEIFTTYPCHTGCLSSSTSTRGFCYGDTGGPVVYTYPSDVAISLIGINSQYQACPSAYPMTYTRVHPYIGWIKTYVKKLLT